MTERAETLSESDVTDESEEEVEVVPAEEVPGDPEAPTGEAEAPYYPDPRGVGEMTPDDPDVEVTPDPGVPHDDPQEDKP